MDNLEKKNKFLETYNLPKLNQEDSENLNRQVTSNKIEAVIKKLPTNKSPGQDGFSGKFYRTFKNSLLSFPSYSKNSSRGNIPKLILQDHHIILKLHKDTTKKIIGQYP